MNKKKVLSTIIISLIGVAVYCFVTLIITPKITNSLGVDAYGFVSLSRTFVAYTNIIMVALNTFAARYITIAYERKQFHKFNEYFSTVFWGNVLIGGILTLLLFVFTSFSNYLINIPSELVKDVKILFLLTFSNFFITSMGAVFSITGYVKDKQFLVQLVKGISYVIEALTLVILFFYMSPRVYFMGVSCLVVGTVVLFGNWIITKKYLPEARKRINDFSFDAFKTLIKNGIWNSINSLGNVLNSGLDLLVTNLMLTATGMGQIAIAKNFSSMVSMITSAMSSAFHPSFLRNYSSNNNSALVENLKYASKVSSIPSAVIFAGIIVLGKEFLYLWIPGQNINLIYILIVISLIPCVSEGTLTPLYYIYTLTLKNRIPCIVTVFGGLLNVAGMYILLSCTNMGLYAIVITTAVIMSVINYVINPLYMCKCLNISKLTFYPTIVRCFLSLGVTVLLLIGLKQWLPPVNSWIIFIIEMIILGTAALVTQILCLLDCRTVIKRLKSRRRENDNN